MPATLAEPTDDNIIASCSLRKMQDVVSHSNSSQLIPLPGNCLLSRPIDPFETASDNVVPAESPEQELITC